MTSKTEKNLKVYNFRFCDEFVFFLIWNLNDYFCLKRSSMQRKQKKIQFLYFSKYLKLFFFIYKLH
jgi:hypothetical protein